MKVESEEKSRFLHSVTAKNAVTPVGMTSLHFAGLENECG